MSGGMGNVAYGYCTVGGGSGNLAAGWFSTVAGGSSNSASGGNSTVAGGSDNTASGAKSTVGGGSRNTASGICATVAGGYADTTAGDYSFATGYRVRVDTNADYTFAFGRDFTTSTANAAIFYNSNDPIKVGAGTPSPTATLDVNGSTGYSQLRVRTSFTPSASSDTLGNVGDIAWDDDYMYIRTSAGWKRTALSTF